MTDAPERIWRSEPWHPSQYACGLASWPVREHAGDGATEYVRADLTPSWQPIETAPKDQDILVWFDHDADPYQDPDNPNQLTDYAALADGGDFLDGAGVTVAKWHGQQWEAEDEYGGGYWLPAGWFSRGDHLYYEVVCNPTHWMPLPAPPAD